MRATRSARVLLPAPGRPVSQSVMPSLLVPSHRLTALQYLLRERWGGQKGFCNNSATGWGQLCSAEESFHNLLSDGPRNAGNPLMPARSITVAGREALLTGRASR